tara:strand:- start:633 stop:4166 length:3534 start_codon:yes stop_codon:yes gene_type:complete
MEQNQLYNTGSGLSVLDDQHLTRLTIDECIVNNDLQLPNGLVLPTDLLPLQTMRNNINSLTNNQLMIKTGTDSFSSTANNSSDWNLDTIFRQDFNSQNTNNLLFRDGTNSFGSIGKSNDYSNSTNDVVHKTSGVIKTNKLTAGDSDLTTGDININKSASSGSAILNLINYASNAPKIYLIRNASSSSFGGDTASDWAFVNGGGHLDFDRGNSGLTNGYVSPLRLSFTNAIEINQNRGGAVIDHCPLRHYRQVAGNLNNYYVDVFPDSGVTGTFQQKLPAENGTYVTTGTTDYINLNTMNTNFNSQTTNNLLFRDGTNSFGNIGIDNGFGSGSLIVQKDTGTIKSENFLAEQAGNGYMFQSFSNPAVISYLYHSNNSGTGVAVELPSSSGVLGLTSQIAWNISGSNISTKNSNDNVGIGTPSSFPSRITFGGGVESKICLFDGGNNNIYGFGVSSNQLNYHTNTTSDSHCFYVNGTNGNGTELMRIQGNKQIFLGQSGGDGIAGSGDVIISNRNDSNVELEFRSDDTTLSSPNDWLIGKIKAGFTSGSYTSAYFKFQTHHANNTTLNDTFELKGSNATLNGTFIINQESSGIAKIILQDQTDHDDIDILFQGFNGSTLIDNAVIRTESNYLSFETSNNTPMNGIRLSTNNTLAMTIDNNQNAIFENQVGIGKSPATGFALDVDGTLPSLFRGDVNYLGQAVYVSSFPPKYENGLDLNSGVFNNTIDTVTLTQNRSINFPNSSGTVAVINSGQLQVDELVSTLGSSTKIDLAPGGGNIDLVVPNSAGGLSPNVDINFKTDTKVRMNLNSIDGIVFHENFIFKNTTGSTYFPLSFNGSVANSLNVGTAKLNLPTANLDMGSGDLTLTSGDLDIQAGAVEIGTGNLHMTSGNVYIGTIPSSVPIGIQTFHLAHGVTTAGVEGEFGVAKIGNGLADYAMFSHASNFTTGNYALLQQNDGETFLNCASTKQIHFRVNNATRAGIDDETGKERVFFIVPNSGKPLYNSSGKIEGDYNSMDNITFRQFTTGGTQNERTHMYSQIVVDSSTTPFTQVGLPLQDYGTQPGFVSGSPGFAFRVCDPTRHAQVYCQFSGYTSATNALQTVKLQLFSKQTNGTNAWVDICSFDFYVNTRYEHQSFSFSKMVQFTHSYYSFARFVLVSGTFTGDTGDFFHLSIDSLPRLTR